MNFKIISNSILLGCCVVLQGCIVHSYIASATYNTLKPSEKPVDFDTLQNSSDRTKTYFIIKSSGDCKRAGFDASILTKNDVMRSFGIRDILVGDTRWYKKNYFKLPKENQYVIYEVANDKAIVFDRFIKGSYGSGNTVITEYFDFHKKPLYMPQTGIYYLGNFNALQTSEPNGCKASFKVEAEDFNDLKQKLPNFTILEATELDKN